MSGSGGGGAVPLMDLLITMPGAEDQPHLSNKHKRNRASRWSDADPMYPKDQQLVGTTNFYPYRHNRQLNVLAITKFIKLCVGKID